MIGTTLMKLGESTELLQYYTGSVTVTQATKKYAGTGIHTGLTVGDTILFAGCAQSASNGVKTVATLGTNELTVEEAVGVNEGPTASVTVNQYIETPWMKADDVVKLVGAISCTGNAYVYIDQGVDNSTAVYTTTLTITGGTAQGWSIETLLPYARMRVYNNGADQTAMAAYLYGRIVT